MSSEFIIRRLGNNGQFEVLPHTDRLHAKLNDGEVVEAQDVLTGKQLFIHQERSGQNVVMEAKPYSPIKIARACKETISPLFKETASAMALLAVYLLFLFEMRVEEVITEKTVDYLLLGSGLVGLPYALSALSPFFGKRGIKSVLLASLGAIAIVVIGTFFFFGVIGTLNERADARTMANTEKLEKVKTTNETENRLKALEESIIAAVKGTDNQRQIKELRHAIERLTNELEGLKATAKIQSTGQTQQTTAK